MKLVPIDLTAGRNEATLPAFIKEVLAGTRAMYGGRFTPPWIGYLAEAEDGSFIGTCAFKSAPVNGEVEIAYFTFPDHEHHGVATRMAAKLVEFARKTDPKIVITAQTLPQENASTTVLRRNGFQLSGPVHHPEDGLVWHWELHP